MENICCAFADHGAAFYSGSGNDAARALDLASANVANRPTLRAFEQALSTCELLMTRNPGDVQSQVFSVVPRLLLADLDAPNRREYLTAALAILKPLASANRLDAKRLKWIPQIEAQLSAPDN